MDDLLPNLAYRYDWACRYNQAFDESVSQILDDFYTSFHLTRVRAEYIKTDNMVEEYTKLRPDHVEEEPDCVESLIGFNGLTVCPDAIEGTFTVLLNNAKLHDLVKKGNNTWIGTIAHETTHVRDHVDYAELIHASDYEAISDMRISLPFQLWTEFNARSKGYYIFRKYTYLNMHDKSYIGNIVKVVLPEHEKQLYNMCSNTQYGDQQLKHIASFLGRLYTLQDTYPCYFTRKRITRILAFENNAMFSNNPWILEWYWFLKKHHTIQSAYNSFEEMKQILQPTFPWI